ncbi:MAG TPA: hypothetical protein VFP61_01130 [Acidimicrobiales bacterium]|nr:hypothetical protein [Acidimicrobiales bacterium]
MAEMVAVEVVTLVAVALLGVLVVGLLRSNAELHRAFHSLGVDLGTDTPAGDREASRATPISLTPRPTPARPDAGDVPDLVGTTPGGDGVGLAVGGARHDTLIAFLTTGCSTCKAFWQVIGAGPAEVPGGARLVVVTRGAEAESPAAVAALAGATPVVMSTEAWQRYDVPYAPYFVYVSGPGSRVLGEGAAATWDAMTTLIRGALADSTPATSAPGAPVPAVPKAAADAAREARIDRDLAAAGILPGDPRLHPPRRSGAAGPVAEGAGRAAPAEFGPPAP